MPSGSWVEFQCAVYLLGVMCVRDLKEPIFLAYFLNAVSENLLITAVHKTETFQHLLNILTLSHTILF
jgi:hypothetical protein